MAALSAQANTVRSGSFKAPSQALSLGVFVEGLDRDWRDTPFLFQGFLLDDAKDLQTLQRLCQWVLIDPERSQDEAVLAVKQATERLAAAKASAPAPAPAPPKPARPAASIAPTWLRDLRLAPPGPLPQRDFPPHIEIPENDRLELLPPGVLQVRYPEPAPFEAEVLPANAVLMHASDSVQRCLDAVASGGELDVPVLLDSSRHLAISIVTNPDAMQWLVQMRQRYAHVHEHSLRVAVYMMSFARHLGFAPTELVQIALIGLLLDVGKLFVPAELLKRAGPLDEDETRTVREHVVLGLNALRRSSGLDESVLLGIAEHHERVDGSGYPRGMIGAAISIYGRMAGVCDVFAAMTAPRPYAPTHSPFAAIKTIRGQAETKFHGPLVEQFLQAIGVFPPGSLVELSTGHLAVVLAQNPVRRLEPRVLVVTDAAKRLLKDPFDLDLMRQETPVGAKKMAIVQGLPDGAHGVHLASIYAG